MSRRLCLFVLAGDFILFKINLHVYPISKLEKKNIICIFIPGVTAIMADVAVFEISELCVVITLCGGPLKE